VWRRDFDNGIVLVNFSKTQKATIALEKTYRLPKGSQAPDINNGEDTDAITLDPLDGRILLAVPSAQTDIPMPVSKSITQEHGSTAMFDIAGRRIGVQSRNSRSVAVFIELNDKDLQCKRQVRMPR
jgi:hypothetical protein